MFKILPLTLSMLLWAFVTLCYWRQPDSFTAITIWPVWAWAVPGLLLVGMVWIRPKRYAWAVLAAWLAFLVAFAEEPRSLARSVIRHGYDLRSARLEGEALRVVSLNCAGGSAAAAAEAARHKPDIVLLQESPSRPEVEHLAQELFGEDAGFLWGVDASILARGRVYPIRLDRYLSLYFVVARVELHSGLDVHVASVRLLPPVFRMDLWSPDCWMEHRENRLAHREQVFDLMRQLDALPKSLPLIVGGDLNVPQGDGALDALSPRLHDTFGEGGRGWGNTILNDTPVLRIDQVWASEHLKAVFVAARETQNSDHRMVICDLIR